MNRQGRGGRETKNGEGRSGEKRTRRAVWAMMGILLVLLLAGCGKSEETAGNAGVQETVKTEETEASEPGAAKTEETEASEPGMAETEEADAPEEETAEEKGPVTMADLLRENGNMSNAAEAPELPETILWFNATYACITYCNGWDWRWVGGQEPTEENVEIQKYLLYSGWNILDRESGIETVNKLLQGGHRAECKKCMDQLQEWGLMDLDPTSFGEEVISITEGERTDIDLGDVPGRYVLAYYMYHKGIDTEYMAAWDLCRVNQLYGKLYLCGFMDYEEAMDASLENSLRLQEMYDSWDEMMEAYLFGYQFWQGDLGSEDSETAEMRRYYEMLKNSNDNPYELDWNMELKKSW